jgi:CheY-like chemotaxis protein
MTRIAVVEDGDVDRMMIKRIIDDQQLADELLMFEDGESFIEYLKGQKDNDKSDWLDFIILDLHLPGMEGFDVLEEIKQDPALIEPAPQLYILTSSISKDDKEQALKYSTVKDVLVKPLTLDDLTELLVRVLS